MQHRNLPAGSSSPSSASSAARVDRTLRSVRLERSKEVAANPLVGLETLPVPSLEAIAGAMFVATAVACWIAVASTATGPLMAAGELLGRAARVDR